MNKLGWTLLIGVIVASLGGSYFGGWLDRKLRDTPIPPAVADARTEVAEAPGVVRATANPSLSLIQMGVNGVTDVGGSAEYANFLIKTDENGTLDLTLAPTFNPAVLHRTHAIFWLDGTDGEDLAGNGAHGSPYKTLDFALADAALAGVEDPVFVFAPGTYTNSVGNDITDTDWDTMTFMSESRGGATIVGDLELRMLTDTTVNLYGVQMEEVQQWQAGQDVTVNLHDYAGLTALTVQYAPWIGLVDMTVNYDPTVSVIPPNPGVVVQPFYNADALVYNPNYVGRPILTGTEYTVEEAFDEICEWALLTNYYTIGQVDTITNDLWTDVETLVGATSNWVVGATNDLWTDVETLVGATSNWVVSATNDLWTDTEALVAATSNWVVNATNTLGLQIVAQSNWVVSATNALGTQIADTSNWVVSATNDLWTDTEALVLATSNWVVSATNDLWTDTEALVGATSNWVVSATNSLWTDAEALVAAASNWVVAATNTLYTDLTDGSIVPVWVATPASPIAAGNAGEVSREWSGGVPYFYWYDETGSRWARVTGSITW